MEMNLREALHLCELRMMPQGHPAAALLGLTQTRDRRF
jgi:hypothetical protein